MQNMIRIEATLVRMVNRREGNEHFPECRLTQKHTVHRQVSEKRDDKEAD